MVCFHHQCIDSDGGVPANTIASLCKQDRFDQDDMSTKEAAGQQDPSRLDHDIFAVMSQSNARVRKALHRLNVVYSVPYGNSFSMKREAGEFHLLEEELKGTMQPPSQSTGAIPAAHGPDSLLLFRGHDAVHGLFEFLINRKRECDRCVFVVTVWLTDFRELQHYRIKMCQSCTGCILSSTEPSKRCVLSLTGELGQHPRHRVKKLRKRRVAKLWCSSRLIRAAACSGKLLVCLCLLCRRHHSFDFVVLQDGDLWLLLF